MIHGASGGRLMSAFDGAQQGGREEERKGGRRGNRRAQTAEQTHPLGTEARSV